MTATRRTQARRTWRALWWGWRAEFSAAAEYRADLVSGTLVSSVWLGLSIAPMLVVARYGDPEGWTLPQLLFLAAVWYLLDAVMWMILANNSYELEAAVQDGSLDGLLLRPVDSLLMCSLRHLYVQDVPKVVLAVGLGVVAIVTGGGPPTPLAAVCALVCVGCACVLFWAAGVLTSYKALSHVRFDLSFALVAAHNLARVPTPLYGPVLHAVLTVVVPVAFLTTVPAQVFFGALSPAWALVSLALTTVVVRLTAWAWRRELERYTGAMG